MNKEYLVIKVKENETKEEGLKGLLDKLENAVKKQKDIVLNMQETKSIVSVAIGALIHTYKKQTENEKELILTDMETFVEKQIREVGLYKLPNFHIYPTQEDYESAIKYKPTG